MVGGFELAGRLVMGVRAVVEAAVGKRAAEPFVKEQEEQGDLNPFWGMLLDRADMLDEGVTQLGLRAHRQHSLVEGVHQLVHLAERQSACTAPPRACPDAAACPQEPGIIFLVRRTGSAECGSRPRLPPSPPSAGIRPSGWSSGLPAGSR